MASKNPGASQFFLVITLDRKKFYIIIKFSGKGVNVILDCVGSSFWEKNIKVLAVDGRWVLYGTLGGGNVEGNLLGGLLKKRGSLIATTLKHRPLEVNYS